jgi:formylglycine-generating enzyme
MSISDGPMGVGSAYANLLRKSLGKTTMDLAHSTRVRIAGGLPRLFLIMAYALACLPGRWAVGEDKPPLQCDRGLSRHSLLAGTDERGSSNSASPVQRGSSRDAAHRGMVWIPGGRFWMGSNAMADAQPPHQVDVSGFWIDRTVVTNEEFARFVKATGYVTVAERPLDPKEFPTLATGDLQPGGVVFTAPAKPVSLDDPLVWWRFVKGANWRHPRGPASDLRGKEKYPVVQIAWSDAVAYANWAGKRLPSEAEFEIAQRGGLDRKNYAWGDKLKPAGNWQANIFQGSFPDKDAGEDGHRGIAPVASYPPNGYGLYDMAGNVWQWTADWYRADYFEQLAHQAGIPANPQGPTDSFDPQEPNVPKRVQKGGSFLCSDQYCQRYIAGTRGKADPDTPTNHVGFRCVRSR